ncbi:hypothetical protein SJAV_09130 [Sulfurisphaera javensis]|uniref:Uncharacterized protein n=1 Tax=Sulfurisphaera javensis TaxID=2049879 RepID=A0AAT9GQJ9_9CREN
MPEDNTKEESIAKKLQAEKSDRTSLNNSITFHGLSRSLSRLITDMGSVKPEDIGKIMYGEKRDSS